MTKISCLKITYMVFNACHFCYTELDDENVIWCEGAIYELAPTAFISRSELVEITTDEFKQHHYSQIKLFTEKANTYDS